MDTLHWEKNNKIIQILSFKDLFHALIDIPSEKIDSEIKQNKSSLKSWIKKSGNLQLQAHMNEDCTPQQLREQIVRDLRQIIGIT